MSVSMNFMYPCDAGTSLPIGYHKFEFSNGFAVCKLCGYIKIQPRPNNLNDYLRLVPPDEDGMAYLTLDIETETHSAKQVEGKVIYDLDDAGNVIGVEFLFAPKNWLVNEGK